jgi:hypothetical protein
MATTAPKVNGRPPAPVATKGLYAKLAEVTAAVGYVAKDGRNDFQNYRYTSAEALLAAIRGPLSDRQVVLMPSLTALSEREYMTSKGKASVITTAHVSFTLIDGESGESHECAWAGQGDDPGDKGLGKAYTNAIKTFLREQFLIPQGDDPEADSGTDQRAQDRAGRELAREIVATRDPATSQPTARPAAQSDRPASAAQKRMLNARAGEAGLAASELANVLLGAGGAASREWPGEDAAAQTLGRLMDRLPARLVDDVLEGIARIVNDRESS